MGVPPPDRPGFDEACLSRSDDDGLDWYRGKVEKLKCQYRRLSFPNNPSLCKSKVTRKYVEDREYLVDCDVWIEDGEGTQHTVGAATVALLSRGALIRAIHENR